MHQVVVHQQRAGLHVVVVEQAAERELDDPLCPARPQAEMLIKAFYEAVGWTVEIKWKDRLEASPKPGQPATPTP